MGTALASNSSVGSLDVVNHPVPSFAQVGTSGSARTEGVGSAVTSGVGSDEGIVGSKSSIDGEGDITGEKIGETDEEGDVNGYDAYEGDCGIEGSIDMIGDTDMDTDEDACGSFEGEADTGCIELVPLTECDADIMAVSVGFSSTLINNGVGVGLKDGGATAVGMVPTEDDGDAGGDADARTD